MIKIHTFIPQLSPLYCEPHRGYHSLEHIHYLLRLIDNNPKQLVDMNLLVNLDTETYDDEDENRTISLPHFLSYVAWFHDAVYDPYAKSGSNEKNSAMLFLSLISPFRNSQLIEASDITFIDEVGTAILSTASHMHGMENTYGASAANLLFLDLDLFGFSDTASLARTDVQLRKEYAHISDDVYIAGRIKFLETLQARDRIYYLLNDSIEQRARDNIELMIRKLKE